MKKLTNMTTHSFDLEHFGNNAGLKEFLRRHSLDGLELMEIGEDEKQILQKEDVVGFHLLHYPCIKELNPEWLVFEFLAKSISSKKNSWMLKKFILSKLYI